MTNRLSLEDSISALYVTFSKYSSWKSDKMSLGDVTLSQVYALKNKRSILGTNSPSFGETKTIFCEIDLCIDAALVTNFGFRYALSDYNQKDPFQVSTGKPHSAFAFYWLAYCRFPVSEARSRSSAGW
ncbi:MAG TPA: hypothetical protein V6C86_17565 [Oculatellaceae cyanobacterium]